MAAGRASWMTAIRLSATALAVAAVVNGILYLVAGDVVRVPGELTVWHPIGFTVAAVPFVAAILRLVPARWQALVVVALAVLTLPFPFMEFATSTATWLAVMHVVAAVAAVVAARQAAR